MDEQISPNYERVDIGDSLILIENKFILPAKPANLPVLRERIKLHYLVLVGKYAKLAQEVDTMRIENHE